MQKFGLQVNRSNKHGAVELEIAREQASALGRAGKKLRISLEIYESKRVEVVSEKEEQALISDISDNLWGLMLQREFLGFTNDNISWIKSNYVIPEAAIKKLGTMS